VLERSSGAKVFFVWLTYYFRIHIIDSSICIGEAAGDPAGEAASETAGDGRV
jgi:hypothetical protein